MLGLYREMVDALNRDLAQFEQVKQIALLPAEFTIAGGELTPTLKVRRRVVETRWQDTIERMYALSPPGVRSTESRQATMAAKRRAQASWFTPSVVANRGLGGDAGRDRRIGKRADPAR